jgi:HemY protein
MLRALWFLLKLSLLSAALIWVARQPAYWITMRGLGYEVQIQASFLAFLTLLTLFIATRLDRIWRGFIAVPTMYRRYRRALSREQGYRALTDGLVAVAAGDERTAEKLSRRAARLVPDTPLTKLLTAQAALLRGDAPAARREFTALLDDRSAAFFGLRGLLNETLETGNYREALDLIRRAHALEPKRVWVVKTLFELETRNREWLKAERTLRRAEKLGVFDAKQARAARQALWTAMSDEARAQGELKAAHRLAQSAFSLDPGFSPAATRTASLAEDKGKRRQALKTVQAAWAEKPHPDLGALWMGWTPPPKRSKSVYDAGRHIYDWAKKLGDLLPDHPDGHRLMGKAAMDARMWREARDHLMRGQDHRALARLETEQTGDADRAREWLDEAAAAPPEPRWVCHTCGQANGDWQALCPSCGNFNSLQWTVPGAEGLRRAGSPAPLTPHDMLLAPPAATGGRSN